MSNEVKSTKEKALEINLDDLIYGTFAEIGAGQEVARNFFRAGAASGTVAKTLSAYDMVMSDTIYGKEDSGRYVIQSRLKKMLDREYNQLIDRLAPHRKKTTLFFAFADTVATTNFNGDKDGHGWLGVRFQHESEARPSELVLHVMLKDKQPLAQQYLIGVVGVNMIHACFKARSSMEGFINSLLEFLDNGRITIDMIKTDGPAFEKFENRLLSLELLKNGFTDSVFFDDNGEVFQPTERLYKKHLLVLRGSFRPPTLVSLDMLSCGLKQYSQINKVPEKDIIALAEITMNNLHSWGDIDGSDFLARVDLLSALGIMVTISSNERHFRISSYFKQFTDKPLAMVLGVYNLKEMFTPSNYDDLEGGILESFGVLLKGGDKLLVYPYQDKGGDLVGLDSLEVDEKLTFLYEHLKVQGLIQDIKGVNTDILHIYSRRVLNMIGEGDSSWEEMVPKDIVDTIKNSCLFGFCDIDKKTS